MELTSTGIQSDDSRGRRVLRHQHHGRDFSNEVVLPFSDVQFDSLVEQGYTVLRQLVSSDEAAGLADLLETMASGELAEGASETNGYYYCRNLVTKHRVFGRWATHPVLLPIARALLGYQVRAQLDARLVQEGAVDTGIDYHVHMPGALDPLPPWYSRPHNVNCLVYLEDVTDQEGALAVVPRSHEWGAPVGSQTSEVLESEVLLYSRRGDCVVTHGNLWHRALSAKPHARRRVVFFVAYVPAWLQSHAEVSGQIEPSDSGVSLPVSARDLGISEVDFRDLMGGFRW